MYQTNKFQDKPKSQGIYIRSSQVILYDKDNTLIGTVSAGKAKFIASERGLELFPINANSNPAIYKLSDGSDADLTAQCNGTVPDDVDVRLMDDQRNQIGIVKGAEARKLASDKGLDLIIVAEKATPMVCMIGDLNKYLYNKKKQQKEMEKKNRAAAKASEEKEIILPSVVSGSSNSDMTRLVKQGNDFLTSGHPVRFKVKFPGRQVTHAKTDMAEIEAFVRERLTGGTITNISAPESKGYSATYYILCNPVKKK